MTQPDVAPEAYTIPSGNIAHLEAGIARLNKRAKRLGVAPIVLTTVGEEIREKRERTPFSNEGTVAYDEVLGFNYQIVKRRYILVNISGEAPKIAGWTFVATLQHAGEAGTIVRALPGVELPSQYRAAKAEWCDHCKQPRNRKDTYVVVSEAGEYKQVGSNCLRDFLGHTSPELLARRAEWLGALGCLIRESDDDYSGPRHEEEEYLPAFLTTTAHVIRTIGWKSKTAARQDDSTSTLDLVRTLRSPYSSKGQSELKREVGPQTEADEKLAAEALSWARETLDEKETLSDYESNVKVVIASDYITGRMEGIAASVISMYQRETEREVRRQVQARVGANSQHVGEIKERLRNLIVTVTGTREIEGDYGVTTLIQMIDEQGNVLKWFASGSFDLERGERFNLTGTVKSHGQYNGTKETLLSRCVLDELPVTQVA